jgi:hypothetical protein
MSIIQGAVRRMDGRAEQGGRVTFSLGQHNPDVLTCIANLSNDEVFTPPAFAGEMLDTLADAWAEAHDGRSIWSDATVTFLDPFTKSGVFLREITKRLVDGLAGQMPDLQQRVDHILTRQVFGIGITQLTALLARRSVYCSKNATGKHSIATGFDRPWGNIWYERTEHTWVNRKRVRQANPLTGDDEVVEQVGTGKCKYCGASEAEYSRDEVLETHAYAFIHTDDISSRLAEIFGANVHFDVIIGNPPYQLSTGGTGGNGTQAKPIYPRFVDQAKSLSPRYVVMVTPSRWFSGGMGLESFRNSMLADKQLLKIVDYPDSNDVFPGTQIKGGISYWVWEKNSNGDVIVESHGSNGRLSRAKRPLLENGLDVFIRYNEAIPILHKVMCVEQKRRTADVLETLVIPPERQFIRLMSPIGAFGLGTQFQGGHRSAENTIKVFRNGGIGWASRSEIKHHTDDIDVWKVFVPAAGSGSDSFPHSILGKPFIGPPGTASSWTYMYASPFETAEEAESARSYIATRFFRFLVLLHKPSQHATRPVYTFAPMQTWDRIWTDADLYAKYHLTDEEIAFIESMIRPMELDDDA